MQLSSRKIGLVLIAVTITLAVLTYFYTVDINQAKIESCSMECGELADTCPHMSGFNLPIQSYVSITLAIVLGFLSYSLITSNKQTAKVSKELSTRIAKLPKEEKDVYDLIVKSDGAMFQSEIVDQTKINKVKVTRLLDKLEGKGLIERRRRGMTNLVLLKR